MIILIFISLIALVAPLLITMSYLYSHRLSNGGVAEVRKIIFFFMGAYAFIIIAEGIASFLSLIHYTPSNPQIYIILLFAVPIGVAAVANWWAFYKIKRLL